jgi:copper chaperone CopZ
MTNGIGEYWPESRGPSVMKKVTETIEPNSPEVEMCRCAGSILVLIAICLGCDDADLGPSGVKLTVEKVAGAPTVEFSVPDMMCEDGCAVAVKQILSKQSGVTGVLVDFDAKTATVAIEEGKFDPQSAIATLVDKGFDHTTLADEAPASERNTDDE